MIVNSSEIVCAYSWLNYNFGTKYNSPFNSGYGGDVNFNKNSNVIGVGTMGSGIYISMV